MQRLRRDSNGSALIVVTLTATALFGVAAAVVDVAALLQERRTLQNGADAAALAIAADCGAGGDCSSLMATAKTYADVNADDTVSAVEDLCGSTDTGLLACADPPAVPAGASYVKVATSTEATDGTTIVPYSFARIFGLAGGTVHASAVVAWGGPASLVAELPLTISQCEFDAYTAGGTSFAPAPDPGPKYLDGGGSYPSLSLEAVLYMHDTTNAQPCPSAPSGADLPGGFGWLDTADDSCTAETSIDGWFDDDTGVAVPKDCKDEMAALVDSVIHIPIFGDTNDLTGTNGMYYVEYFASFYLTGYRMPGHQHPSVASGSLPCSPPHTCISGFFIDDPVPLEGTIGGPSNGVTIISLLR